MKTEAAAFEFEVRIALGRKPLNFTRIKKAFQYKGTLVAIFLLIAIPALILIWTQMTPQYTAEAKVRVRPIIPRLVFNTEDNGLVPLYDFYKNTQSAIILDPKVLQRVLDNDRVIKPAWFQYRDRWSDEPPLHIDRLQKSLEIKPEPGTEIICVTMTGRDSGETALILNTVLDEYIKRNQEETGQINDFVFCKLAEEITAKAKEIEDREKFIDRLRKELGTGSPDELVSRKRLRLEDSNDKLTLIDQEIAAGEWQLKSGLSQSPRPAQISSVMVDGITKPSDTDALQKQLQVLKFRREGLAKDIQKQKADLDRTFFSAQLLARETESLKHQRELYNLVRTRLEEKEMEGKVPGAITIIPAVVPAEPSKDPRILFTVLAVFLALGLALGVACLRVETVPALPSQDPASS